MFAISFQFWRRKIRIPGLAPYIESTHRFDLHAASIRMLDEPCVHFALSLPLLLHFRQDNLEVLHLCREFFIFNVNWNYMKEFEKLTPAGALHRNQTAYVAEAKRKTNENHHAIDRI